MGWLCLARRILQVIWLSLSSTGKQDMWSIAKAVMGMGCVSYSCAPPALNKPHIYILQEWRTGGSLVNGKFTKKNQENSMKQNILIISKLLMNLD